MERFALQKKAGLQSNFKFKVYFSGSKVHTFVFQLLYNIDCTHFFYTPALIEALYY
jgi:hypothetical protein